MGARDAVGRQGAAPASAPEAAPARQHVHNSYIWLGSLRAIGVVAVVLVVTSFSSVAALVELGMRGATSLAGTLLMVAGTLGGAVLVVGVVALIHLLAYRHLWYEVGPEEFTLYSGVLSKKRVHVPYQRVQSVDQRASLLQRLFGVCNVTIDTAGGASNKAILVPYLTKQQADTLRNDLFARKRGALQGQAAGRQAGAGAGAAVAAATGAEGAGAAPSAGGAPIAASAAAPAATAASPNVLSKGEAAWDALGGGLFGGEAVDTGAVTYEYGLSNKELVLTGLSNNTAFLVAMLAVLGFVSQASDIVFELVPGSSDVVNGTVTSMVASAAAGPLIGMAIGGVMVIALVIWGASLLGACVSYGGFHARRRGDRIEVERGLLQHQLQGVSIARVQSVTVKQSLIRRLLGYCEVSLGKIDAATGEESQQKQSGLANQGLVVHPFVKVSRVPEILAGLVPEFADTPTEQRRLPKPALRRGIMRGVLWQGGGFWLAVAVAVLQVVLNAVLSDPGIWDDPGDMWVLSMLNTFAVALYVLAAVLAVLDAVGSVLWYRHSSFAVNRRFMQVTNSGLSTETVTFPRQKIQFGCARTNPLQRRAGTATIQARTAAGVGGTTVRLIDVSAEEAAGWLDWLKPRAA